MKWWLIVIAAVAAGLFLCLLISYFLSHREKIGTSDPAWRKNGRRFVSLSGGMTHYELYGEAASSLIVLLHGGTIPMWAWDAQMDDLKNAGYAVLRYDQFGRGLSDRPVTDYTRVFYRRQLKNLLDSVGGGDPVVLVGHCQGSVVAADVAVEYPEMVKKLVLVAPYNDVTRYRTALTLGMKLTRIPVFGNWCMRVLIMPKLVARCRGYAEKCGMDASYYDSLFRYQIRVSGFEQATVSLLRGDITGDCIPLYRRLGRTGIPVLLLWGGSDDNITKPIIDDVHSAIGPASRIEIMDGCGHQPNWERPEEFTRRMCAFLSEKEIVKDKK